MFDAAGGRRSPATMPGYHAGRPPRNTECNSLLTGALLRRREHSGARFPRCRDLACRVPSFDVGATFGRMSRRSRSPLPSGESKSSAGLPSARSLLRPARACRAAGECFGLDRAATQRPGLAQKAERGRAVGLDEIVARHHRTGGRHLGQWRRRRGCGCRRPCDGIPYVDSTDPVALVRGLAGAGPAPDPSNPEVSWPLLDVWTGPDPPVPRWPGCGPGYLFSLMQLRIAVRSPLPPGNSNT